MNATKKACVIFNPTSGRGRAIAGIDAMRASAGGDIELRPTHHAGHAEELAFQAAHEGFSTVIAAGGDGTVHEVANGLIRADNRDVVFSVWPFGSANDYAFALGVTTDPAQARSIRSCDVGLITGKNGAARYFVNGMGIGFNGAVTLEARRIRWLRGVPLYSLAVFKAMIWHFQRPRMVVRLDEIIRDVPTLALTLNIGRREGGFPLTPTADLGDGLFDYLHAGPVSRWDLLRHFPNMIRGTLPTNHPRMWLGRCRRLSVQSTAQMRIHLDGEFFCHPEDDVRDVEVQLLPGRLKVECAGTTK